VKPTTHLHLVLRSKNKLSYTSTRPIRLHGVVLSLKKARGQLELYCAVVTEVGTELSVMCLLFCRQAFHVYCILYYVSYYNDSIVCVCVYIYMEHLYRRFKRIFPLLSLSQKMTVAVCIILMYFERRRKSGRLSAVYHVSSMTSRSVCN
jgi:hypothetical protein